MRESLDCVSLNRHFGMPTNSLNSSGCVAVVACSRLPAVPGLSATASSSACPPASLAVVAHARSTPMHGAHNSWSDTVRVQGPTGRRCTKGGLLPVRAEDLPPAYRLGGRGKLSGRPAGVRGSRVKEFSFLESQQAQSLRPGRRQVCTHLSAGRQGPGRQVRRFTWIRIGHQAIHGLDEGVWNQARSGEVRCYTCPSRARRLPDNPDLTSPGMDEAGCIQATAWDGRQVCETACVHTSMDVEQLSDLKLMTPSGMGLLVCGAGSRPCCHPGVAREGMCQRE